MLRNQFPTNAALTRGGDVVDFKKVVIDQVCCYSQQETNVVVGDYAVREELALCEDMDLREIVATVIVKS